MKNSLQIGIFCALLVLLIGSCTAINEKQNGTLVNNSSESNNKLIWSDEFNIDGLPDSTKWSYDYGDGCPNLCGWGNNELEFYTEQRLKNARIENGNLIIEAHKEDYKTRKYTSARLVSRGKGSWRYKRIEFKAKLPTGKGTWPALWMLSENWKYGGWPQSGEIDIMEHVGYMPDSILGTVHTGAFNHMIGTHKNGVIYDNTVEQDFHIYAIDWYEDRIDFYKDNIVYFTFNKMSDNSDEWPFDQPFHIIMNLAVGGNWGGSKGVSEDIWPQRMEVDYVRVYDLENTKS